MKCGKTFLKMTSKEFKKLSNNKILLILLIFIPMLSLLIFSFISYNSSAFPVAIFYNGEVNNQEIVQVVKENLQDNKIVIVDNLEDGKQMLKENSVSLLVSFELSESPNSVVFYYNESQVSSSGIITKLQIAKNNYINEQIKSYGIKLSTDMFKFESLGENNEDYSVQVPFTLEFPFVLSVVLAFGISYLTVRDNDQNTNKMILYAPINMHFYMLSKILPIFVIGAVSSFLCLLIGYLSYGISYSINIVLIWLVSLIFILSVILFGMILGMMKSQIISTLIAVVTLFLPIFITLTSQINGTNIFIQIILNCIPITPYLNLISGMTFSGIVILKSVVILLAQILGFYVINLIALKKKIKI